jgi:hypothetical protein
VPPGFDLDDLDAVSYCPSCGSGYTARVTRCAPCGVVLVPRHHVEATARYRDPGGMGADEVEPTVLLCELAERVKASLLELELDRAAVPFWMKTAPLDPLHVTGAPGFFEFRVPARYLGEARRVLQRVESYPVEDRGSP